MRWLQKLFTRIKLSSTKFIVTEREFKSVISDVKKINIKTISAFSLGIGILFSALFVIAMNFNGPIMKANRPLYAYLSVSFITIFVLLKTIVVKKDFLVIPVCYLFLANLDFYSLIFSIFSQPNQYAVSFATTVFIAPFLFIDRSFRLNIFAVIVEIFFVHFSWTVKPHEIAVMDILNSLSFCLGGFFVCSFLIHMRVHDLLLKKSIQNEADFDGLTTLFTKTAFTKSVQQFISKNGKSGTLFVIDIDDFKKINDTYGHLTGDSVIQSIANCIKRSFRSSDFIGRFGGDEFVVFVPESAKGKVAEIKASNLIDMVKETVFLPGQKKSATISIGVAIPSDESEKYSTLFNKADKALYEAKKSGKCTFKIEIGSENI